MKARNAKAALSLAGGGGGFRRTSAEERGAAESRRADLHNSRSVLQPQRGEGGCKSNRRAEKPPSGEVSAHGESTEAQAK